MNLSPISGPARINNLKPKGYKRNSLKSGKDLPPKKDLTPINAKSMSGNYSTFISWDMRLISATKRHQVS